MEEMKKVEEAAEISFDEAKDLARDYTDFLAKGLRENQPRPIGPHWFCEFAKNRFIAGAEWCREQMMNEAVEGVVTNAGGEFGYDVATFRFDDNHTYSVLIPHEGKRKYGDKVKVIIIKED